MSLCVGPVINWRLVLVAHHCPIIAGISSKSIPHPRVQDKPIENWWVDVHLPAVMNKQTLPQPLVCYLKNTVHLSYRSPEAHNHLTCSYLAVIIITVRNWHVMERSHPRVLSVSQWNAPQKHFNAGKVVKRTKSFDEMHCEVLLCD